MALLKDLNGSVQGQNKFIDKVSVVLGWITLRKRVVCNIVNFMFVKELLRDHPWCIRNYFIDPPE